MNKKRLVLGLHVQENPQSDYQALIGIASLLLPLPLFFCLPPLHEEKAVQPRRLEKLAEERRQRGRDKDRKKQGEKRKLVRD